jgi:hypothetical protein
MLPFGKLKEVKGTQSQVISRLMTGFEEAGCEVNRDGSERLHVSVPGWDGIVFPLEGLLPLQQFFWDRMVVSVDAEGVARYRLLYWGASQVFMHLLITAVFAFEAWFGAASSTDTAHEPWRFLANLAFAQLMPVLITLASFGLSRRAVLKKALA